MNAFEIPQRSAFAGDPAFYGLQPAPKKTKQSKGRTPKKEISKDELIAYRLSGKSLRDCSEKFGVSTRWIYRCIPDIPAVEIAERKKTYVYRVDINAMRLMRDQGATYPAIAEAFNISFGAVRLRLKGYPRPAQPGRLAKPAKPAKRAAAGTVRSCYEFRLSLDQREFVKQMGGSIWLRSLIDAQRGNQ